MTCTAFSLYLMVLPQFICIGNLESNTFQYPEKISNVLCTFSKLLISIVVTGIDGENYLWGVFVRSKGKRDPRQFGSTTT